MKRNLFFLSFLCLVFTTENALARIRLVTTTELNDTSEGSLQKIWKSVENQDTIMFDESLKNAVITGFPSAGIFTPNVEGRYIAVIGNGVVIDPGARTKSTLTIRGGGYRLENLIVKGPLGSEDIDQPVYVKNCAFSRPNATNGTSLFDFFCRMDAGMGFKNTVKVIVEGSSFTSVKGGSAYTTWSGDLDIHFISCTFESFEKPKYGLISNEFADDGFEADVRITLTNCVIVGKSTKGEFYGISSVTSYGYNVVKGDSGTLPWTPQATDIVDADMENPLVLHGGVYKALADGEAYRRLPANAAADVALPDGVSFPEKDLLGNTIDYSTPAHSGAVQASSEQTVVIIDLRDGDQLAAGATRTVKAELLPWGSEQAIRWNSSATAIATITAEGVIQAIKEGETTITATSEDMHTASATLTVAGDFPLEGVELDISALSLDLGYDRKLNASILPAVAGSKPLTWTSDNEDVASVGPDGTVTAKGTGAAKITVQIDGTALTDVCEVAVDAADYTTGVFIVNEDWFGHNNSTLNYLYPETGKWNYRVIRHENAGAGIQLGATAQHGAIYGGKFYLTSKQAADPGASSTPGSRLAVADAATMKVTKEHRVLAADENGRSIADGRSFLGVDEHKGYIGTSNGIYIINLDTHELTGGKVSGTEGDPQGGDDPGLGGNPGLYTGQTGTMLRAGDNVFAIHQKEGILIIDAATDRVHTVIGAPEITEKQTPYDEGVYGSIVQAKDGSLWASVAVERSGLTPGADFFVRIDPFTFDTTHVAIAPDTGVGASWYAWTPDACFAGINENKLYWAATGAYMFAPLSELYEYNIDTKEQKLLADLRAYDDGGWHIYSSSVRIHPVTDEIYVTLFRANGQPYYRTVRISSATGEVLETYPMENNYWFSSIPVFPDNAAPVVSASLGDISLTEDAFIYLGDKVSDADNLDAAIVKSIVSISDDGIFGAFIRHDTLFLSPLREGSATLRLKFNSNGKVAERELAVAVEASVVTYPVTGVSLNRSSAALMTGETLQLAATVSPSNATNRNVVWTSDNASLASVDANGFVTALRAPGVAVITATTVDGGFKATCAVAVNAQPPQPAGSLTLDKATLLLAPLKRASLTAAASGSLAGQTVVWTSSNTAVADVTSEGVVIALAEGTSTIAASIGSVSATCVVTVRSTPTDVEALAGRQPSVYYAEGVLRLLNLEGYDCYVTALSGQRLRAIRPASPDETHAFRLSGGIYILSAQKNGERIICKFAVL
ncbi:MAG: Ig-like domain-containing protein [Tannerellaceae bacterium]|nr:Ig-like domain-containing protein [Tannerellaceae bacterium]